MQIAFTLIYCAVLFYSCTCHEVGALLQAGSYQTRGQVLAQLLSATNRCSDPRPRSFQTGTNVPSRLVPQGWSPGDRGKAVIRAPRDVRLAALIYLFVTLHHQLG